MTDAFKEKAEKWDDNPLRVEMTNRFLNELNDRIPITEDMSILDFGCGTGLAGLTFCNKAEKVVMVDTSPAMLKVLRNKIKTLEIKNAEILEGDIINANIEKDSLDLIISLMAFHHVENIPEILNVFKSSLKTGGYTVIADLTSEDGSFHGADIVAHKGFSPEYIKSVFERSGFFIDDIYEYNLIKRPDANGNIKEYSQFMAIGVKK
jgi:ubiquinone/menaquinone biosynthesis C-methylase UbiE